MSDSFVQVAPDGGGKQLDTELVQTAVGNINTQRARLTGNSQDVLDQLYWLNIQKLANLRAIYANLQQAPGLTAATVGAVLYPITPAEIAANVSPVAFQYPPGTPERFGAVGDGLTDNTLALVNWAKTATAGLRMVMSPAAVYIFNPSIFLHGIYFSGVSNFHIDGNNATIKASSNAVPFANDEIVYFINCTDVTVENLIIDGNRAGRNPVSQTSTHNLAIETNCQRITLRKVRAINSCADGFEIGSTTEATPSTYPTDILLEDCIADNSFRNGVSFIVSSRTTIRGGRFVNSNGIAPQAGIDFEPDAVGGSTGNNDSVLEDLECSGNTGYGLSFNGSQAGTQLLRCRVTNLSGQNNTAGLLSCNNNQGLDVDGIFCGPHSAATRGLIDIGSGGTTTDLSFKNLTFRGVTINNTARYLFYSAGTTGRLRIDGFRAYNCPTIQTIQDASGTIDINNVYLDGSSQDAAIQILGNQSTVRNLVAKSGTGRVIYITGTDCEFENLTFVDCIASASNNLQLVAAATGCSFKNLTSITTGAFPGGGAVAFNFQEVPKFISGLVGRANGAELTLAQLATFAGAVGAGVSVNSAFTVPAPASGLNSVTSTAAVSGSAFLGNGSAGTFTEQLLASTTSGQSYGIYIQGGTTGADYCFEFRNASGGQILARLTGLGDFVQSRGLAVCLRATAIETRTSTTTLTNSTQLTYAIPAAGTYAFELLVFSYFSTAVTDGITANMNYSGTFTAVGSYVTGLVMNGTTTTTGIQPVEISSTVNNALAGMTLATYGASVAAATPACHVLKGNLIATATGTLAFAFAQSTTGIDTTNLGVGSYMTVTQLS